MQCINHPPDVSLDADNHVTCFCEKNEYTHTWDTYPAHLAALDMGQYGGTVLVTNPGVCSIHHHHEGCEKIYDTSNGYSRPTGTTVRFAKNTTDVTANRLEDSYFDLDPNLGSNVVNELREGSLPAITAAESPYSTGVTTTNITSTGDYSK